MFGALGVVVSGHATELVGYQFDPMPWSPHRSARLWKKLWRRHRRTIREDRRPCAYRMGDKLIVHPSLMADLRAATKEGA